MRIYVINLKELQHIQCVITIIVTKFTVIIARVILKKINKLMQGISLALYFTCFPLHFQELATLP